MNFPIVFRIYAVLNLLAFLAFGFMTLVLTFKGASLGVVTLSVHWTITLWLFISAIAWFFASKHSYHFLISLSFLLICVAGIWVWQVFSYEEFIESPDRFWLLGISGLSILYMVFLIVAAFYKPVMDWTPTKMNYKHHGIAALLLVVITAGFFSFGKVYRQTSSIGTNFLVYSDAEYTDIPQVIKGNQWLRIDLDVPAMVNSLTLPVDPSATSKSIQFAKMYYSDSAEFNYKLAPFQIIEFKKKEEAMVAEFNAVKARSIQLFPMESATKEASPQSSFNITSMSPIWTYGYFEESTAKVFYDEVPYANYADYDVAGEEEGYAEGNDREITEYTLPELYSSILLSEYFGGSEWLFDAESTTLNFSDGETSYNRGMYTQGIGDLQFRFATALKSFREFSGYDYEYMLTNTSGHDFYVSKAKGYDYEGNGTEFNNLNPAILSWIENTLVMDPSATVLGNTTQQYFDYMFLRFMRVMVKSHAYLEATGVDSELAEYESASEGDNFYGPSYLLQRYGEVALDDYAGNESWKDGSDFIGFWLRRKHDGTYDQCYGILSNIMNAYDKEWFETNAEFTDAEPEGDI